ncbi:MAG: hypothetical protein JO127_14090 [Caulobacteraceae bacterium]|nr:hypothetical protein [Caulobacteraceae bacterium]
MVEEGWAGAIAGFEVLGQRRFQLIQAKKRSTTPRVGRTCKPTCSLSFDDLDGDAGGVADAVSAVRAVGEGVGAMKSGTVKTRQDRESGRGRPTPTMRDPSRSRPTNAPMAGQNANDVFCPVPGEAPGLSGIPIRCAHHPDLIAPTIPISLRAAFRDDAARGRRAVRVFAG